VRHTIIPFLFLLRLSFFFRSHKGDTFRWLRSLRGTVTYGWGDCYSLLVSPSFLLVFETDFAVLRIPGERVFLFLRQKFERRRGADSPVLCPSLSVPPRFFTISQEGSGPVREELRLAYITFFFRACVLAAAQFFSPFSYAQGLSIGLPRGCRKVEMALAKFFFFTKA